MWRTVDLLPSSLRDDPQVQSACEALDRQLIELYRDIPQVAFWPDLQNQVSPLLDVLMWEYHVDQAQQIVDGSPFSDEQKRMLIDRSILWHQKKGTKWAVEQILRTAFPSATIVEWFQYRGNPYRFRISIDEDVAANPELFNRIYDAVIQTKNVRSWPDDDPFFRPVRSDAIIYAGGVVLRWKRQVIPRYEPRET